MNTIWTIATLTLRQAQRSRILRIAGLMGIGFLLIYGYGFHLIYRDFEVLSAGGDLDQSMVSILTMTGLYLTNFLVVIVSVLTSVSTIAGEVESGLIYTFVTKPIGRFQIILGKWLGFAIMSTGFVLFLAGGVLAITYLRAGVSMQRPLYGIALLMLNGLIVMSVTLAGGTRLSTLANGVVTFMLFGFGFIGGWVETIGATFRNDAAVNLGIVSSLIMPIEAIWKKAALVFQPRILGNPQFGGPFTVASEPSDLMIAYGIFYMAACLGIAIYSFMHRDI